MGLLKLVKVDKSDEVHQCNRPIITSLGLGSIFRCDTCNRFWLLDSAKPRTRGYLKGWPTAEWYEITSEEAWQMAMSNEH